VKVRYLRARAQLRATLRLDPESEAAFLHDFAGGQCDDTVATVVAQLRARGIIRDH